MEEPKELFKTINFADGIVKVNTNGSKVYYNNNLMNQHLITSEALTRGFMACTINRKHVYIHKLVALAFIKNPDNQPMALHRDTNTLNNIYSNLMWGNNYNIRENMAKANRLFTTKNEEKRSKIPWKDTYIIANRLDNGEYAKDIAKEYNTSEMSIIRIRKRYCKNKVASPRYSEKTKHQVFEMLKSGKTAKETSQVFGMRYETVYRWAIEWNIPYPGRVKITQEFIDKIIDEYNSTKKSIKEIALEFNVSYSTVYKYLKTH